MTAKIGDLTLATTAASEDLIEMERAADGLSRRISKVNFMGGTFTGGGALATGGFTLAVPATGIAALKTGDPVTGRMAQWADENTLANSTLVKTGAGVLTLSASGAFTLTVPATGSAALLGVANVFSANQRINALLGVTAAPSTAAQALIQSADAARPAVVARGAVGQTASVFAVQDSSAVDVFNVAASGIATAVQFRCRVLTLDNNQAVSLTPPSNAGVLIVASNNESAGSGTATFRAAGGPYCTAIAAGANVTFTTGELTGTTGSSGQLTVSVESTGVMYVENRLGGTRNIRLILFG